MLRHTFFEDTLSELRNPENCDVGNPHHPHVSSRPATCYALPHPLPAVMMEVRRVVRVSEGRRGVGCCCAETVTHPESLS